MKKLSLKILSLALIAGLTITQPACTDLDETLYDAISATDLTADDADKLLNGLYGDLRAYQSNGGYYGVVQVSSDETIVPARGTDWEDGGNWRALHQHTWTTQHSILNDIWGTNYRAIFRCNYALEQFAANPNQDAVKPFIAEARALRAMYYYMMFDFYGDMILETRSTVPDSEDITRKPRKDVYAFAVKELEEAIPNMKNNGEVPSGRFTKQAAQTLLAKLYLNAQVYTGTVTTSGLAKGTAQWQKVVDASNAVINSGYHTLENDFFAPFKVANEASKENILTINNIHQADLGLNITMMNAHYTQLPASPWNGFCTIADYYNSFNSGNDKRWTMFLTGPQKNIAGQPVNDRAGNPLVFTLEVPIQGATESNGIRVRKYEWDGNQLQGQAANDFVIFRYADVLLMKAEALNELGNTAGAIELVNEVRDRKGYKSAPAVSPSDLDTQAKMRTFLLEERGRELGWEAHRRQDQIRIGTFLNTWAQKPNVSAGFRVLFPVPLARTNANPKLGQNPGY